MQIHELNTLNGVPGGTDFIAIDTGFDTAKISAKKLLEPYTDSLESYEKKKVNRPVDGNNQPTDGTAGQLLRTNGDGSTEWVDEGLPSDEQTEAAVNAWLDNHPEATTTVADGSLTKEKFSAALKLETIKDYVTPQMYGAAGDGVTDDTNAIQSAIDSGSVVIMPRGTYLVTDTLTIPSTPSDVVGKKRTTIIGTYNDTIINFRGAGNAIENNGSLYMENIRIESLGQNANGIFNSGTLRLYNCQSNGNGENGLMFDESVHVVHSIIEGCTFYGNLENGVRCVTNTSWQKTSIRFYNCYCAGNGSEPANDTAQNDLSGNGILLGACLGVSVIGTVCEYNKGSGILIRNDGVYAVMSATVIACYFEGNRLANIYLYSDQNTLYHQNILIKSNYFSAYPATPPDYYNNSLLPQSIQTVIDSSFKIIKSIVDENYYDVNLYKNGTAITDKPLKCKVVTYTTDTISAGAMLSVNYSTLANQYVPGKTLIALNASIGGAYDSLQGEIYNDYNGQRIRIRNTYSASQYYLLTLQFFYED